MGFGRRKGVPLRDWEDKINYVTIYNRIVDHMTISCSVNGLILKFLYALIGYCTRARYIADVKWIPKEGRIRASVVTWLLYWKILFYKETQQNEDICFTVFLKILLLRETLSEVYDSPGAFWRPTLSILRCCTCCWRKSLSKKKNCQN